MAFGVFTALFKIQDQASGRLNQITAAGHNTVSTMASLNPRLIQLADSLRASTSASGLAKTEFGALSRRFVIAAKTGKDLKNYIKQAKNLGFFC